MRLTSPAFSEGESIPALYTCDGAAINPPLVIDDIPPRAVSLALVMDDPDSPGRTFVHWVAYDLDVTGRIEEGSHPGTGGLNDFGRTDYVGPCPHSGTHRYVFKFYALDQKIGREKGLNKDELLTAIEGHIIARGELIGRYSREDSAGDDR
ncbi:MAG: YbhB/YbcL family Raf kinase inhibitor-like protein [Candidatus Erginobacter occultus]|nr:YbhB/YbcL family Raf kinase inhibitor-like protein [Candidatus Erginobacter occultus]